MSGFVGYILNATYVTSGPNGRAIVHLYGRLQDGRPFLVRDGRDPPYFYIEGSDRLRAQAAGARSVPTEMRTLHGARVHRVELAHPQEAPRLRERLHRAGAPTYEADVRFAYRYLIDRGIRSAVRIHGNPALSAGEWSRTAVFDEPSLEPADWTPELTTLSLDLETDPEAKQIYSVSLWGCGAQEVLLWCPDEDARAACPSGATPCADEAELLTLLCRRIRELDPDVLTGWSIIDFDVPVLIRRAAAAGVALDLGRAPGELRQRDGGARRFSDSIFIPGRTVLDGIRLLRAVGLRLPDYSLETASRHILGEGKTFTAVDHAAEIQRAFARDPERFVQYNLTDARLAFDILEKLRLVPFTVQRSLLTGMPPDRAGASIAAFDFLYLSRLRERGVVAPTVPVQPAQLRREHRLQIPLRVSADRRIAPIEREVGEVVQLREQVHLRELADAGEERELHVRVARLDRPVQPAQVVAVGARHLRLLHQRVQDRLVVLVHQHHHPLPGLLVQSFQQICEAARRRQVFGCHPVAPFGRGELLHDACFQQPRLAKVAAAEVQPHHRMPLRPVVAVVDVEPREQLLVALEQLLQRVQEQALAEPPRARQEVVLALVEQPLDVGRLVDVVAVLLAQLAEGLQPDRQSAPDHGAS